MVERKLVRCNRCNYEFEIDKLQEMLKLFLCPNCCSVIDLTKPFKVLSLFPIMPKCKICNKELRSKRGLKLHMERKHKSEPAESSSSEVQQLQARVKELEAQLEKAQAQPQLQQQLQQTLASLADAFTGLKEAVEGNPEKLLRDAKGLVMAIANDPQTARASGFTSGINTAVIKNEVERALNGQISFNELINLIDNGWNWIKGYFTGDTSFQETIREVEEAKHRAVKSISDKIEEEYGA